MITLTVTTESDVSDQGSVVLVEGTDEGGNIWWFAGEPRLVYDMLAAATQEGEVQVEVEGWQLWGGPR